MSDSMNIKIAIIGLGYVGLPLAVEFGKVFKTIGFDTDLSRIEELILNEDSTLELNTAELKEASKLSFTNNAKDLRDCNIYIIAVPTPIDEFQAPNLDLLVNASKTVGKLLKNDDIVIFESTVYPGTTQKICVPVIEKFSGLRSILFFHLLV